MWLGDCFGYFLKNWAIFSNILVTLSLDIRGPIFLSIAAHLQYLTLLSTEVSLSLASIPSPYLKSHFLNGREGPFFSVKIIILLFDKVASGRNDLARNNFQVHSTDVKHILTFLKQIMNQIVVQFKIF